MGFCPQCRSTGSLAEVPSGLGAAPPVAVDSITARPIARLETGIAELDRVLGGGVVPGSVVLLGGAPGIGKSTLVLQFGAALAASGKRVLLASGEESIEQIGLRASRIEAGGEALHVSAESDVERLEQLIVESAYQVVVVDSIQTVTGVDGSVGSPSRMREAAARLTGAAKRAGVSLLLIGHVTKDGTIAGPKTVEHMVDVVLALDGDAHRNLRFLRGQKNRFGSVDEVGVFEMTGRGLAPVDDPSLLLAGERRGTRAGTVLFPALDGRRPMLVEVQALAVATSAGQPRRSVKGLPIARVHQILAALERHVGIDMGKLEIHVAVMGGVTVSDPAADLPIALAVVSAVAGAPLGSLAAFGEVGLTGEVRDVDRADRRRSEATRLGIEQVITGGDHRDVGDVVAELGLRVQDRPGRRKEVPLPAGVG